MPIVLAPEPEIAVSVEESRAYLGYFISWAHDFLIEIRNEYGTGLHPELFISDQIAYLNDSLSEVHDDNIFGLISEGVEVITDDQIRLHGLYGAQLKWKLSNINHWLQRFWDSISANDLRKLLEAIETLLKSLLEGIPGSGAAIELYDAVKLAVND